MVQFEWGEFGLLYSNLGDDEKCAYVKDDLEVIFFSRNNQNALGDVDGVVISTTTEFDDLSDTQINETLRLVKSRARSLSSQKCTSSFCNLPGERRRQAPHDADGPRQRHDHRRIRLHLS